jgi:hypothetical protein
VLDDLTPLQQMTDDVRRAAAHLFRPERAVRVRRSVNRDTPLPSEIPHGTNPPAGAVIDYWLQAPPAGAVTLEVLDARGGVIRRFSSDDRAAPPARPRQPPQFTSDWLPRFEPPTRNAGLNRFAWDLRYPPPPADAYDYSIAAIAGQGTVAEPQGPLVPPGEYQVRLTVAGRRYTQPLRVEMDPRVRVSDAALGEQLRLALQIWNALAEQYAVAHGAVALRDQLRALAGGARRMAPETKTMVDSLARAAAALADAPTAGDLAALETVIQSADREPTQQARDAFAELRARLDRDRARWEALRTRELAALNARLAREKVPQVRLTAEAPARVELPVR